MTVRQHKDRQRTRELQKEFNIDLKTAHKRVQAEKRAGKSETVAQTTRKQKWAAHRAAKAEVSA